MTARYEVHQGAWCMGVYARTEDAERRRGEIEAERRRALADGVLPLIREAPRVERRGGKATEEEDRTMNEERSALPERAGTLVRTARKALAECIEDGRYAICMRDVHRPLAGGDPRQVSVGYAGALLAQRLGVAPTERHTHADGVGGRTGEKLAAVEALCRGDVHVGLHTLGVDPHAGGTTVPARMRVREYSVDPEGHGEDLRHLEQVLEAAGY